jgi:hypothetical protein
MADVVEVAVVPAKMSMAKAQIPFEVININFIHQHTVMDILGFQEKVMIRVLGC